MKTKLYSGIRNKMFRVCILLSFALSVTSANAQCTFYQDLDGDGFGNPANSITQACSPTPVGYVANNIDCDDTPVTGLRYADEDEDGFGDPGFRVPCNGVTNNLDCHDDELRYADNDNDGFGFGNPTPCGAANNSDCDDNQRNYADADHDGFGNWTAPIACGGVTNNFDCDDTRALFQDNDGDGFGTIFVLVACGGVTNSDDCSDAQVVYEDNDGDGFGSAIKVACGGVLNDLDCDDTQTLYQDNDNDGFGVGIPVPCNGVANSTDCNDNLVLYIDYDQDGFGTPFSLAPCDGVTNNLDCEKYDKTYADVDGDGFGSQVLVPCDGIADHTDCDDSKTAVHPGATESLCDGIDNDCNGVIDAGTSALTIDAGPNKIVYRGYADSSCTRLQSSGAGGGVAPRTLTWSNGSHAAFINVCPTATTVYYLTVTDANGCSFTDSVKVCVMDVRCGSGNKKVLVCHGTGSVSNPYVTLCLDKADAANHFRYHPGEQLGTCGIAKGCGWNVKGLRLSASGFEEIPGEPGYLTVFPNPFENTTTVRFILPEDDFANVKVFDVAGREIENLFDGVANAGNTYELTFSGSRLANGVYFLILKTQSGLRQTKKMILNK